MYDLGITYFCYHKYDKALSYFEKSLTIKSDSPELVIWEYFYAGRCYLLLGRHLEAIAAFQKVVEFPMSERGKAYREQQGKAYRGLSLTYKALGQPEKAAEYDRKAIESGWKETCCTTPGW